jgi:MFS family permease
VHTPYRQAHASIAALLVSVFGVLVGNGILTTLIPVRAELEGFSEVDIGLMGSAYFLGMLAGATLTPWFVQRLGHIKAFGASSAVGALGIVALGVLVDPYAWIAIRGLSGFFLAGIYAIVESYLQGKAENRIRGRLLGLYSITQYAGWAVGGQMMRLAEPTSFALFGVAATIVVLALLPLLLAEDDARTPGRRPSRMNLEWLYRISPVGAVCTVLIGFANGPFWTLTPAFATTVGLSAVATGTLMSGITLGAAAFQLPVGRLSDAMDRRLVLVALSTSTAAAEIVLFWWGSDLVGWPLIAIGALLGGLISTQYYVASAHTNDRTGRENAVGVSSALLFLYCIGAIVGPFTASLAMRHIGPEALFLHNGGIHIAMAIFVIMRIARRAPPPRGPEAGGYQDGAGLP